MKKILRRILVALHLTKMNRSEKITQGKATHEAVAANTGFFPAPETATLLGSLKTATDDLSAADADTTSGSHASFEAAEVAELQFDMALRNMGYYVQTKADALPEKAGEIIKSAAFQTKSAGKKMQPPHPLDDLQAKVTGNGNSIKLRVVTDNPRSTHIEILMTTTPDVESSWISIADITARKLLVQSLVNGTRYYFKARAINSIGKSIYTGVVSQLAA